MDLKYHADMNDAPVSYMLRQASNKTENRLMAFTDYCLQYFQTLVEVQDHTLSFIKVRKFTMAHLLQDQLLNKVQKVSTMQNAMQEWL